MQFGNIFVDIEVEGESIINAINRDTGLFCAIIETAGASLPYAYIKFTTFSERIMNLIQLGNTIKVTIGNDSTNKDTFTLDILPPQPNKDSFDTGWIVEVAGFLGNKSFMINHRNKPYKGNSLIVTRDILKEELGNINIINDFDTVQEEQVTWMRTNKTASHFLAEVLTHANMQPSFPLFSFDKYLNFYIRDVYKSVKEKPKYKFVAGKAKEKDEIPYHNNFNPTNYKQAYNLYSGYDKISEIQDINSGTMRIVVNSQSPIISSSNIAEEDLNNLLNLVSTNDLQSSNVHKTYNESFLYNTNKLLSLSSLQGILELNGKYYRELKPLDLVYVEPNDVKDTAYLGNYIIDTIVTEISFNMSSANTGGVKTLVYVTRDNKNNVENYSMLKKLANPFVKSINILKKRRDSLLSFCSALKSAYSLALRFFDGEYLRRLLRFAILTKNGVLQAFGINQIIQDLTSQANAIRTLILGGNSLMNSLLNMLLPQDVYNVLKDFLINENTSAEKLIRNYLYEYTPTDILNVALLLVDALSGTTKELIYIAKDNGITIDKSGGYISMPDITNPITITPQDNSQARVENIIDTFENNTTGLNIPFPIITLTESEKLLSDNELKDYIANRVIENLDSLNYLKDVNPVEFKEIILGNEKVNFDIIDQINKNVGDVFLYRFWGTYDDLLELTSFKIKKSYKDKYKTIPCTKIISALDNKKIFFCCPQNEDIKFYVNSKLMNLDSFEISLGYLDAYKIPIVYNVYYTEERFNSSSVLLEVRLKAVL